MVTGHYPQDRGPQLDHDGAQLLLDSNAGGMQSPSSIQMTSFVTLARLEPTDSSTDSQVVMVPVVRRRHKGSSRQDGSGFSSSSLLQDGSDSGRSSHQIDSSAAYPQDQTGTYPSRSSGGAIALTEMWPGHVGLA